ncbi:MAG TPA: type IV toxin-antitoxin system AbiEi family antitoxin domain-containing protein [Steroidobacteraceae bacterium]|nr:type IV toxin-antitoxin system AbiEi family antitoxin domain-containing protein [Steroidobacteraceae bacterium]
MSSKPSAQIPANLPPVFTYSDAIAVGLSAERLYRYRDEGLLEQLGRGLYRRANASPADHSLLEISHRVPEGTLCLTTALARHGLTDIIPDRMHIAIPRGRRTPTLQSPVNIHVFAKDTFGLGREVIRVADDLALGLYSAERSLVDMIRLRHREGAELAWEALRRWLRRKGARPAALIEMARSFHGAERAVHHALEVVL